MNKAVLLFMTVIVVILCACNGSDTENTNQSTPLSASKVISGEEVYKRTCVACHQATGEGVAGAFPPLAKSDYLADKDAAIKQVLKGSWATWW